MAVDFLIIDGNPSQSNGVGTATAAAAGGSTQDADGSDARRFAALSACIYYQKSADTPVAVGTQTYNTNVGPIAMQPYAASGNNIGSAYPLAYLGLKHGLWTNPMYAVHAVGSTGLLTHWDKVSGTSHYADGVAFYNARVAEAGRNIDAYISKFNETDANSPAAIANFSTRWTAHFNNLKADVPGLTSNTLYVMVLVNPNASLPGDGDVAGMRNAQIAFVNANPQWVGVDPGLIPVASDPHYRAGGYWSLGEKIFNAIRARKFPGISANLSSGPTPWVQADGPLATTQNNTTTLRPRGASGSVGEVPARCDYQVMAIEGYTAATTHTVVTAAGFTQLGTLTDSVLSTNHRTFSLYGRPVLDASMVADAFGRKHMPTPAVRVDSSDKNLGQIYTIANVDPVNPIQGMYFGTNDANSTGLGIPKVAPGTPFAVKPGSLAVAFLAENGATQTISSLSNPDTGAWTIHRDQVVNPGSGSVGTALASAVVTGTSLRQTTVTYGTAGVNVGAVLVFNQVFTADGTADIGGEVVSATGGQSTTGDATANIGADLASADGFQLTTATASASIGADLAAATGSQVTQGDALASIGADVASATGGAVVIADALADIGAEIVFAGGIVTDAPPVLYCTVDDLQNAVGLANMIQLTDLDNHGIIDNNRAIAAIRRVDGIINSYINKRYSVPLAVVPESISELAIDWSLRILRGRAFKQQPLQEDIDQEKIDREWLEGVATGEISLGVEPRPLKSSNQVDLASRRDARRKVSLRRMKGFI